MLSTKATCCGPTDKHETSLILLWHYNLQSSKQSSAWNVIWLLHIELIASNTVVLGQWAMRWQLWATSKAENTLHEYLTWYDANWQSNGVMLHKAKLKNNKTQRPAWVFSQTYKWRCSACTLVCTCTRIQSEGSALHVNPLTLLNCLSAKCFGKLQLRKCRS